jgi:hypothetical protein
MRSVLEMVADVFVHQALEMALVLYEGNSMLRLSNDPELIEEQAQAAKL